MHTAYDETLFIGLAKSSIIFCPGRHREKIDKYSECPGITHRRVDNANHNTQFNIII